MPIRAQARDLVTDHVIIRWLERVEGYDFTDIKAEFKAKDRQATDQAILSYLAHHYGLYKGHVIYKILTKPVQQAIALGAKKINRGEHTLIIDDKGIVVTMVPRKSQVHEGKRMQRKRGSIAPKEPQKVAHYVRGKKVYLRVPGNWQGGNK